MTTDALTPAAAALRDVLGLDAIPYYEPGRGLSVPARISVTLLADRTRREQLAEVPEHRRAHLVEQAEVFGLDLDVAETVGWAIHRPSRRGHAGGMDLAAWLEWEASKMPAGYVPVARAAVGDEPVWTVEDVARYLQVGQATVSAYLSRGRMPAPDGQIGRTRWWYASTIRSWRPRGGAS